MKPGRKRKGAIETVPARPSYRVSLRKAAPILLQMSALRGIQHPRALSVGQRFLEPVELVEGRAPALPEVGA